MKQITLIVLTLALTLSASCSSSYYQVYEVSADTKTVNDTLVFENEDIKVAYNFWSKGGDVNFMVYNKAEKDIYLDMTKMFFIKNGFAQDYYRDLTTTSTKGMVQNDGYFVGLFYGLPAISSYYTISNSNISTTSVSERKLPIVCIPAKTFKIFNEFSVNPDMVVTCQKKSDFPYEECEVAIDKSTYQIFSNVISYGFDENGENQQKVRHDFYISKVTNYSLRSSKFRYESVGCSSEIKYEYVFQDGAPCRFYKKYYAGTSASSPIR